MTVVLIILLWVLAVFFTLGLFNAVMNVGKPREPLTHAMAAKVIALSAVTVAALVTAALVLA